MTAPPRLAIDPPPTRYGDRYPRKAVIGEHVPVEAAIWRDGHEPVSAELLCLAPGQRRARRVPMRLTEPGLDRWTGTVVPDRLGLWRYRIEAWADPWRAWQRAITIKMADGADDLGNDLEEGARLLERAARRPGHPRRPMLRAAAAALRDRDRPLDERVAPALDAAVAETMAAHPLRLRRTRGPWTRLLVEPPIALRGAWYEFFPRSTGGRDRSGRPQHGTFATAAAELPRIADMHFDVVYLPPVHPIGQRHRKGRNNSIEAGPEDVGSPWAIGSAAGGHDSIHPDLGTLSDFRRFVATARSLGLEVAMDLALQCSPDHPWVREHPEWFTVRPDGTVAYAENPPKKYQDIYPLNFDTDPAGLGAEVLRVVLHWIDQGVRIFRVDNPHTKPPTFWPELFDAVRARHPDVVFLSEAFTRPAVLAGLAARGFSQSYTYFTWRTTKAELVDYLTELRDGVDHLRPNLWVNTPDILPAHLVGAPPAAFAIRAALAATLGPSWGMYSGFELFENTPLAPGREEYLDSEKYELRPRDYAAARRRNASLEPWIAWLNQLRREHPAFGQLRTLHFHDIDDDHLIAYSKTDPATGDAVLCLVNLDPDQPHRGRLTLDRAALGARPDQRILLRDLADGRQHTWTPRTAYRIDPAARVARVFSVEKA